MIASNRRTPDDFFLNVLVFNDFPEANAMAGSRSFSNYGITFLEYVYRTAEKMFGSRGIFLDTLRIFKVKELSNVKPINHFMPACGLVLVTCLAWLPLGPNGHGAEPASIAVKTDQKSGVPEAEFVTREIKTAVEPGVAVVDLCYEFRNTGDFPLAVEAFSRSCGCMSGVWDGKPVEPGAKGKIKATFLTAGLRGKVRKSLRVRFLDMGTAELVAEVNIPEAITYSAQTLRWELGSEKQAKQIDIVTHTKSPLHVLSVSGNDPAFTSTLETLEDGRRYRVTITPRDTDAERVCVFQVRTDAKDSRDAIQGLFALVEKSACSPPPVLTPIQ